MKDFKENFNLKDWKVHVLCLVIMVIAELIGTMKIAINGARGNGISFSLIPMLFAIMIGIILWISAIASAFVDNIPFEAEYYMLRLLQFCLQYFAFVSIGHTRKVSA